jgi:hypothetical protein
VAELAQRLPQFDHCEQDVNAGVTVHTAAGDILDRQTVTFKGFKVATFCYLTLKFDINKVGFKISPSSAAYIDVLDKANLVIILARNLPFTDFDTKKNLFTCRRRVSTRAHMHRRLVNKFFCVEISER